MSYLCVFQNFDQLTTQLAKLREEKQEALAKSQQLQLEIVSDCSKN